MTEVANSVVSRNDRDENRIEENDPLFELSQIMGFGEGNNAESRDEIDPQIDLEDALMAEISGGDAPQSPIEDRSSLEDELSAMLSGKPYVREPVIEPEAVSAPQEPEAREEEEFFFDDASFDAELESITQPYSSAEATIPEVDSAEEYDDAEFDAAPEFDTQQEPALEAAQEPELEATQEFEAAPEVDALSDDFFSAELRGFEPAQQSEPEIEDDSALENHFSDEEDRSFEAPSFSRATPIATFGGENAPLEEAIDEISALEEAFTSEANLDLDDASLDDDFSALFEDELSTTETSDDVRVDEQTDRYDPFAEMPAQAKAQPIDAPVLETTDMSAYVGAGYSQINVPNLPEFETESARSFDDEFASEFEGDSQVGVHQEPVAAVSAVDDINSLDDFDDGFFEAELARDMEFVSHDLNNPFDGDDESFDDQDYIGDEVKRAPVKRSLVIGAALGICAILGVVGVFALGGSQTTRTDSPVLIKADTGPTKVAPEDPGGAQVPNQDLAVFEEGASAVSPSQEALVTSSEEPVDITSVPDSGLPSTLSTDLAQKGEDRLTADGIDSAASDTRQAQGISPRKVKTLIVKPDGTLVEREVEATPEPTVAVSEPAPAATEVAAAEPAATETPDATAAEAATTAEPAAAPNEVAALPTRTVTTKVITPETIASRPKEQPVNLVQPETPAAPAAAATAVSGFAVQLASLPTQADAQVSADRLSRQYADLIGERGVNIQKAEIAGKGTYYRVRVGASSRADAISLCERLKASGGSCFVSR